MHRTHTSAGFKVVEGKSAYNHLFGGRTVETVPCPTCGTTAHLLFRFDLRDPAFDILQTDLPVLPLVTCLNCSGSWESQSYKITGDSITDYQQVNEDGWVMEDEDLLPSPLPETSIQLLPLTDKELFASGASEDERDLIFGNLGTQYVCRLFGGQLTDEEEAEPVTCSECHDEMVYVASVAEDSTEGEAVTVVPFVFGETIFNFFFCGKCRIVKVEPLT